MASLPHSAGTAGGKGKQMKIGAIALAGVIAAAPLAGCNNGPVVNPATVQQIIADCVTACEFVPTVESVTALFVAVPALSTVSSAVGLICDAFKKWEAEQPPLPAPPAGMVRAPTPKAVSFPMKVNGATIQVTGTALHR